LEVVSHDVDLTSKLTYAVVMHTASCVLKQGGFVGWAIGWGQSNSTTIDPCCHGTAIVVFGQKLIEMIHVVIGDLVVVVVVVAAVFKLLHLAEICTLTSIF